MKRKFIRVLILNVLLVVGGTIVFSQDDSQTRSITSDDFASRRPAGKSANPKDKNSRPAENASKSKRATYKYVREDKDPAASAAIRRKTVQTKQQEVADQPAADMNKPADPNQPEKVAEVGITMWKLRPPRSSDNGYKLPVLINDLREMWTAERVNPDTTFRAGDRVRLAVESSDAGYLYVFDSEIYSGGTYGEPFLIFPSSTDEDNSVQPGMLVDIPDQQEELPYFLINPRQANYAGELLTVIISPKPLSDLKADKDGRIENPLGLSDLEASSKAEVYSRGDAEDKIYTPAEAGSACGAKTRQLVREKSTRNPCGAKSRQLTREEPLPQTIYRIKTRAGQPAVVFIKLNVGGG